MTRLPKDVLGVIATHLGELGCWSDVANLRLAGRTAASAVDVVDFFPTRVISVLVDHRLPGEVDLTPLVRLVQRAPRGRRCLDLGRTVAALLQTLTHHELMLDEEELASASASASTSLSDISVWGLIALILDSTWPVTLRDEDFVDSVLCDFLAARAPEPVVLRIISRIGDTCSPHAVPQASPVCIAAFLGYRAVLNALLALDGEQRIDFVHERQTSGEDLFTAACRGGHVRVVDRLLALDDGRVVYPVDELDMEGVDEETDGDAVLHEPFLNAARLGRTAVVRRLLALDGARRIDAAYAEHSALVIAADAGSTDMVKLLVQHDATLTQAPQLAVQSAARNGHADVLAFFAKRKMLGDEETVATGLAMAIRHEQLDALRVLTDVAEKRTFRMRIVRHQVKRAVHRDPTSDVICFLVDSHRMPKSSRSSIDRERKHRRRRSASPAAA